MNHFEIKKKEQLNLYYPGMFDFLKGLAMIGIIISHTKGFFPEKIFFLDNGFSMKNIALYINEILSLGNSVIPMFFMVSGFGFRPTTTKKCFRKQIKLLFKPYAITAVAAIILHIFTRYCVTRYWPSTLYDTLHIVMGYFFALSEPFVVHGETCFSVGAVWFLFALFLSWNILNFIIEKVPSTYVPAVVSVLVLIGWGIGSFVALPLCICQSLIGTGYLYIGWLIKRKNFLSEHFSYWKWMIIIGISFISQIFGSFRLSDLLWEYGLFDIVGAGCLAFIVMWLALRMNQFQIPFKEAICMIGRYSLWIMCIHSIESQSIPWYVFVEKMENYCYIAFFIMLIMKGCFIYVIYRGLIWYNLQKVKKKRRERTRKNV